MRQPPVGDDLRPQPLEPGVAVERLEDRVRDRLTAEEVEDPRRITPLDQRRRLVTFCFRHDSRSTRGLQRPAKGVAGVGRMRVQLHRALQDLDRPVRATEQELVVPMKVRKPAGGMIR
jgi:hypothetical protein